MIIYFMSVIIYNKTKKAAKLGADTKCVPTWDTFYYALFFCSAIQSRSVLTFSRSALSRERRRSQIAL